MQAYPNCAYLCMFQVVLMKDKEENRLVAATGRIEHLWLIHVASIYLENGF